MSVQLPTHTAQRHRPEPAEDEHGWVMATAAPGDPGIAVACNLQLNPGLASVTADEAGGAGPYQPRVVAAGDVYMDEDADVQPGDRLVIAGTAYVVGSVEAYPDPTGGPVGCKVARVQTVQ